jgi:hypothetical protein
MNNEHKDFKRISTRIHQAFEANNPTKDSRVELYYSGKSFMAKKAGDELGTTDKNVYRKLVGVYDASINTYQDKYLNDDLHWADLYMLTKLDKVGH